MKNTGDLKCGAILKNPFANSSFLSLGFVGLLVVSFFNQSEFPINPHTQ